MIMSLEATARSILDTMLGHLGFVVTIEESESHEGFCLQVLTEESKLLIGEHGERLDDIQYLLNRLVHGGDGRTERIRVDVEHFREIQEDALVQEVKQLAASVKATGQPAKMRPLNSYFRRLVHTAVLDDPGIMTWSPPEAARLKRVTLMVREGSDGSGGTRDASITGEEPRMDKP